MLFSPALFVSSVLSVCLSVCLSLSLCCQVGSVSRESRVWPYESPIAARRRLCCCCCLLGVSCSSGEWGSESPGIRPTTNHRVQQTTYQHADPGPRQQPPLTTHHAAVTRTHGVSYLVVTCDAWLCLCRSQLGIGVGKCLDGLTVKNVSACVVRVLPYLRCALDGLSRSL